MADDPHNSRSDDAAGDGSSDRRAANLFDLRRIIGGLFLVYGAILFVLGLGASDAEIDKAAGWNLNLWVGVAMIAVGVLFVAWGLLLPLSEELEEDSGSAQAGGRAGAHGH